MPQLIILQGSKHSTIEIETDVVTIGRASENTITIDDENASRQHCKVEKVDDGYYIIDLKSFNGTYLNQVLTQNARLKSGDKIQVGATIIIFVTTEEVAPVGRPGPAPDIELEDPAATVHWQGDQGFEPLGALESDPVVKKLHDLRTLLGINKAINSELDLDRLLELIMDKAISLLGAERGFLILTTEDGFEFAVARNIEKVEIDKPEFNVSTNVIKQVLETGRPVLTSNAQNDFGQFLSIIDLELRSLLCVPLNVKDTVLGTIYLDSRLAQSDADQEQLDLLTAFADQAAIAIENARLLLEVRDKERLQEELRIASAIQNELIPKEIPRAPGILIHGQMETAKEVGGDYFDFILGQEVAGNKPMFLCVGDVSGKGVGAGMVMTMTRSIIHTLTSTMDDPREILVKTNELLRRNLRKGMFMSIFLMRWDPGSEEFSYTGAGFERPLIYRAVTKEIEELDAGGIVLGVMPDVDKMLTLNKLELSTGDAIVVYTDGITEAMDKDQKQYSRERLDIAIQNYGHLTPKEFCEAIVAEVKTFVGGADQHDDITIMVAKRL